MLAYEWNGQISARGQFTSTDNNVTKAQPEGQKTQTDATFWLILPDNNGMDTVKLAMPKAFQASDGTNKERPLTKNEFLTEQANDSYYREVSNALCKPRSAYSYDRI